MSENVYNSFSQLALCEPGSFEIELDERTSPYTVMAIHGGEIEPGTTDIARAIAGGTHSFYTFRGVKAHGNRCRSTRPSSARTSRRTTISTSASSPGSVSAMSH